MTVLVQDTFTGDNGTAILGRTTEIGNKVWQRYTSNTVWQIENNQARPVTYTWDSPLYVDAGIADNVKFSIKVGVYHNSQQIHWRVVNNTNFFIMEDNKITRVTNGSWVQRATFSPSPTTGDVIRIEVTGSIHKIFVNDVLKQTVTDAAHATGTGYGFSTNSTTLRLDDFTIEDFNTGGSGITQDGQAILTASGLLTATGQQIQPASAYLQGQGTLSADAKREQLSTASLLAQTIVQADSQAIRQVAANLLGNGILTATADGVSIITASANLLASGKLDAVGNREQSAAASILAQSILSGVGQRIAQGITSLYGQGVFNVDTGDVTIITASADLQGSGRLTADSQRIAQAVSSLIGNGLLDIVGQRIVNSQASLLGSGLVQADSYRIVIVDASLVGSGILTVLDGEPVIGTIHLKGDIRLNVYLVGKRELNVNLQGKQSLNVHLKGAIQ